MLSAFNDTQALSPPYLPHTPVAHTEVAQVPHKKPPFCLIKENSHSGDTKT